MGDSIEDISKTVENSKKESVNSEKNEKKNERKIVTPNTSEEEFEKMHESVSSKDSIGPMKDLKPENKNKEKVDEKIVLEGEKNEKSSDTNIKSDEESIKIKNITENMKEEKQDLQRFSVSVANCAKESKVKIVRNQSDIFSLKDVPTTLQTSIFSVNGCPSRRVFRKQEPAGHVFQRNEDPPADKISSPIGTRITKENYNDEKRPSSSYRNPLTGSGLSSNDEYKSKGTKRKDGNPLLGLGYDSEINSVASQHRIPPGGYAHKLW